MSLLCPYFYIAQAFVEKVFDEHNNWIELLQTDENYKNRLQLFYKKHSKLLLYIQKLLNGMKN